jgi:pimeloyl-ACP methyl ester carboxylesterase
VPETAGGRRAGQSELRLSRRARGSQSAERPHHQAHGREIPRPLAEEAARSRRLSRRRAGEATKRAHLAATEACHRELIASGAELSAYNSTESAADFADLRKVHGFTKWNIYGTSYGSYLAQTMRDHPDGLRSVVLDSVLPTTYNVAENWQNARDGFDNIFQACAAEPACNAAHPHLEQTFTGLVNKLEAEPLTATVKDPATAKTSKSSSTAEHWSIGCATRTMPCPCFKLRRIASMDSPPAAPTSALLAISDHGAFGLPQQCPSA